MASTDYIGKIYGIVHAESMDRRIELAEEAFDLIRPMYVIASKRPASPMFLFIVGALYGASAMGVVAILAALQAV